MNKKTKDIKEHPSLLTPTAKARFKAIGNQSKEVDPIVVSKFICGDGVFEVYLIDYDPENNRGVGYWRNPRDKDQKPSLQFISIDRVEKIRDTQGYCIELDPNFKECRLSECVKELRFKIRMEKLKQKREDQERNKDQDIYISSDI